MRRATCGIQCLYRRTSKPGFPKQLNICLSRCRTISEHASPVKIRKVAVKSPPETDELLAINTKRDAEFLDRSLSYGITSIEQLNEESSFLPPAKSRTHLVDADQWRSNLNLWQLLLDYGIEAHGVAGAKSIWRGLKYRRPRINLGSEDELTTTIWLRLLGIAAKSKDLTFIGFLCERNGVAWQRPKLFSEVISVLLRNELDEEARLMCHRLQEKYHERKRNMLDLFLLYNPIGQKDLLRFFSIYDYLQPDRIYDEAVRHVWAQGRADDAFFLHKSLIQRGDFPSSFANLRPFIIHLAKLSQDPGPFLRQLVATGAVFVGQARLAYDLEQQNLRHANSTGTKDSSDYAARPQSSGLSDSFTAKAFATRGLSFDFVLNSLRVFGLTEIGPQALREIGIAANSLETLSVRLAKLDQLEIDTGGSAYARTIRKLCNAKESVLLRQVLKTDMHHDVFEDRELQWRLLQDNVLKNKWSEVNILLTMLNHGDVSVLKPNIKAALLSYLAVDESSSRTFLGMAQPLFSTESRDPTGLAASVVERMIKALRLLKAEGLSRSQRLNRVRFIAGFMQDCIANGASFTYFHWRHIFAHLGSAGGIDEIHALMLWTSKVSAGDRNKHSIIKSQDNPTQILNTLFDFNFQASLMHWSSRRLCQLSSHHGACEDWRKSLRILKHFEEKHGLNVNLLSLRKAIVMRSRHWRHTKGASKAVAQTPRTAEQWRKTCLDMLRSIHDIWSTSPTMKREELSTAFRSLRRRKVRHLRAAPTLKTRTRAIEEHAKANY